MKPETTRVTARRLWVAVLAALHFVAAPCVMAMSTGPGDEPCEHCATNPSGAACAADAADPANDDSAPGPGRSPDPDASRTVAFLLPRLEVGSVGLQVGRNVNGTGRRTGRHAGDPPLNLSFVRFLN